MQNAFLVTSKGYTEKQAGMMFFAFGMSQFLFQTPCGYLLDYTKKKVHYLGASAIGTTLLTLATAAFATANGGNLGFMIFLKILQGAITALIPPGLNSITQGIVGTVGMTSQVANNEMMNHLGTAFIVLTGSLLAFALYPNIGMLFIVSPIACAGVIYYLAQIQPGDIDHDAARGLVETSNTTLKPESFDAPYNPPSISDAGIPTSSHDSRSKKLNDQPSFNFGLFGKSTSNDSEYADDNGPKANTPLQVLKDPTLLIFILICFTFHLSNGTVLPLVMQTLALENGRSGILLSGFCVIVAQAFMVASAKICGTYSGIYGRKLLFLIGLLSVPLRCAILTFLLTLKEHAYYYPPVWLKYAILSTQILDGVGAGFFGTMYVLVTSDISGGSGRFSLTLGMTTAAMSIGGTVSGYLGQALAQDLSYRQAFMILGGMSLVPSVLYFFFMPETLPEITKPLNDIKEGDENESDTEYKQVV
jgi:MFS family permease